MKRLATALTTAALLTACSGGPGPAQAPAAPPPLNPTGTYAVTVDAMGQSIEGTMMIGGATDAYTGSISSEMGETAMSNIVVAGDNLMFSITEFGVDFTLTFDGDSFTGEFGGAMGAGTILGVKTGGP